MKKVLATLLVAVLLLSMFTACGSSGPEPTLSTSGQETVQGNGQENEQTTGKTTELQNWKIALLVKSLSNQVWQKYEASVTQAAEDLGVTVKVFDAPAEDDYAGQLELAYTLVNEGYDAIIASSITNSNLIPAIKEANDRGTVWIAVGEYQDEEALAANGAHVTASLVMNYYDEGLAIAEYVAEQIDHAGEVAIVAGTAGLQYTIDMDESYREVFSKYPDIEIVAEQDGEWSRETSYHVASAMIEANPNLKAIIAMNDTEALGVISAVEAAGKTGQILVTGADATEEALLRIQDGTLAMSADICAWQIAYYAMCAAVKALDEGLDTIEAVTFTPCLITAENVDEVLEVAPRTIDEMYEKNINIYLPIAGRLEE